MVEIHVPALAERKDDLPLLTKFFLDRFSAQFHKNIRGLTQRAQILIARHQWPGNVRELENVLGHGAMMAMAETIDLQDFPEYLRTHHRPGAEGGTAAPAPDEDTFADHEKRLIMDALAKAAGNQSQAARSLRLGRDALRYKMQKHGLL
jgi:DNA-binding NtrC family response regulator